jgi:hypothetical protein
VALLPSESGDAGRSQQMALHPDNSAVMQQTPLCADNGVLLEDDKPVLPGLPIRAATLPALTRLVVNVFSGVPDASVVYVLSDTG